MLSLFDCLSYVSAGEAQSLGAAGDVKVKMVLLWTLVPFKPNGAPFSEPQFVSCRTSCTSSTTGPHFLAFAEPFARLHDCRMCQVDRTQLQVQVWQNTGTYLKNAQCCNTAASHAAFYPVELRDRHTLTQQNSGMFLNRRRSCIRFC